MNANMHKSLFSKCIHTQLDDGAIQKLEKKLHEWKDWVQRTRKEQDEKTSRLAMEARMSCAKDCEISKLKDDLNQSIEKKEVQYIIL